MDWNVQFELEHMRNFQQGLPLVDELVVTPGDGVERAFVSVKHNAFGGDISPSFCLVM